MKSNVQHSCGDHKSLQKEIKIIFYLIGTVMNVLQAWKLLKNKLLQSEMFEVGFSVKSSEVWCEIDIFLKTELQ